MKNNKTKIRKFNVPLFKKVVLLVVLAISVALITTASIMLSRHQSEIQARANTEATNRAMNAKEGVLLKINDYTVLTQRSGGTCEKQDTLEVCKMQVDRILNEQESISGLHQFRFFKDDKVYSGNTLEVLSEEVLGNDLAIAYRSTTDKDKTAFLGLNKTRMSDVDPTKGYIDFYEFYSPVYNSSAIDGVAIYFTVSGVRDHIGESFRHTDAVFSTLCTTNGQVLIGEQGSIYDLIGSLTGDLNPIQELTSALNSKQSKVIKTSVNGVSHLISVQADKDNLRDFVIVEFYETNMLAKETVDFINSIVAVIIIFAVIMLFALGFIVINHFRLERKFLNAENTNIKLGCLNRHGFEKESDNILFRQNNLYYGVVVVQLRHYKFLYETYGESEVNNLIDHLRLCCLKTCKVEETYGYITEGEFVMLIHAKDKEALIDRLKIHAFLASQYKGANKFDVSLKYGIYEHAPNERMQTTKMLDYAFEALNSVTKATVENVDMQFNFYNDELRKIRLLNEDMELRQEGALKDGEFQVFYQAKYNLKLHRQDGAEALVRWYDPKTGEYNKPYLFMPLFESNGFIEKLDKYVYTKVCEYISYSIASGKNVFPVSVNVSRITATQPDFIDYYARTKKRYNIPNGALTIEFTESFAYENYDILKDIVARLHKAGFKCSIDDFGCGYSSYRILKELPMDEIKLDKFFIDYSEEPERINLIFDSVISLAKGLKMKVTQEGVEREEDVELLKEHGCDVIQGYIYAKPVSLTDYLHFCEHSKDHNL